MGVGVITNPIVVVFALLVLAKELGIWQGSLLIPTILVIVFYIILSYFSTRW